MYDIPFRDPFFLISGFFLLGMAPFVAILVTSYVKLVVVMSLIRNALGVQQVPPNMILNGLAIIISLYIMLPIVQDTFNIFKEGDILNKDYKGMVKVVSEAKKPIHAFLKKNAQPREAKFFFNAAKQLWPVKNHAELKPDDLILMVPAFAISELTAAFEIGFLLYLPFITIDLVISNILLAMGMMMVSPMTISLPFKLLLFVLLNGWSMMLHGLILTYT